ncbi:MAG: hypothetical protein HND48_12200 [Chloroflexi bacterium]|nr:hypothetical protein [Chloroflexota bacterium]
MRLLYNLSYNPDNGTYGNNDLAATFNRYLPVLQQYATSGNKIILIFNHQTYGEARGYVWGQMSPAQWDDLIASFVFYVRQIAQQFASLNLIYAYQIWNEQDLAADQSSRRADSGERVRQAADRIDPGHPRGR